MLRAMKLDEKGRFRAPPKLDAAAQRVSETVRSWPTVHARAHWLLGDETTIDGADFYVGERELGHIHLDSEAHVMQVRSVADAVIAAKLGRALPWSRSAVVFPIASRADVEHALWLFRLQYDRLVGVASSALLERVRARVGE